MKRLVLPGLLLALGLSLLMAPLTGASPAFNDPAFAITWNRVDKIFSDYLSPGRGYTWGPPVPGSATVSAEPYEKGTRKVQYFDKARMEINQPGGNPGNLYYVTTGLLVKELVTGQRQDGNNSFTQLKPSALQVAGDFNGAGANAIAPTYASFQKLVSVTPDSPNSRSPALNSLINASLSRDGTVKTSPSPPESRYIKAFDEVTRHNIADVFVDYGNLTGPLWNGSRYVSGSVFFGQPLYVLGRPISEPYWTRAVVARVERPVLVQLFERRTLTYTPANPPAFKVEMGNVGQHYFNWRYLENGGSVNPPALTPARPVSPVPTPTPAPLPPASGPALDFGVAAMLNLYNLPQLGAYTQSYEVSSHDPAGGNYDSGNYLYQESGHYVIFDDWGPGAVYRLWMAGTPLSATGRIQFYFDHEAQPRIDMPVVDFFGGKRFPFVPPLTWNADTCSGGNVSYVPMPYRSRLKIATTAKPAYYQINYQRLAGKQNITSFSGQEDYARLFEILSNPGKDPKPANPGRQLLTGEELLRPGKLISPGGELNGPGIISALKLKLTSADPNIVANTTIRITWEGREWAQVDAPLDFFFGSGSGKKPVSGLMAGMLPGKDEYYFYFPMPFHNSARISLLNRSDQSAQVRWEIAFDPDPTGKLVTGNSGYFHATYKKQHEPPVGQDFELLKVKGRGRYVGTVLHFYSELSAIEGDERVYVDGSSTPHLQGTGWEDYFNAAYVFKTGPFSRVLSGSLGQDWNIPPNSFASPAAYRFLLGDSITFNTALEVGFEHGYIGRNTHIVDEEYDSLAFWYGLDESGLTLTDSFSLGDAASERDHEYSNSGVVFRGPLTASFEGENDEASYTTSGYRFSGGSQFTLNLNPANSGVILRRLFDYNDINQQANIYVDGQLVGRWFSGGQNLYKRWRDEDFAIPGSYTSGKNSVRVRVEVIADPAPWSEFYYQVYCLKPGLSYLPVLLTTYGS
ncbi:MAG TPA: glycoside hydrolase family 172 protein [Chloroflexia bacterium]|nr:glycoside hydrolase family 172 protein [Chloroflexia bacterium]